MIYLILTTQSIVVQYGHIAVSAPCLIPRNVDPNIDRECNAKNVPLGSGFKHNYNYLAFADLFNKTFVSLLHRSSNQDTKITHC